MMPPRRRSTRCRVDSETEKQAARRGQALPGNSRYPPKKPPQNLRHLSGCCSLPGCAHPPAVCPRRSSAAGQGGSLRDRNRQAGGRRLRPGPPPPPPVPSPGTFFILDLGLDVLDGVVGLHLQGDGFTRQRLHEDLHLGTGGVCGERRPRQPRRGPGEKPPLPAAPARRDALPRPRTPAWISPRDRPLPWISPPPADQPRPRSRPRRRSPRTRTHPPPRR